MTSREYKPDNRSLPKGAEHKHWKGDAVGYAALHEWVRKNKPEPVLCEDCGLVPPKDLANIRSDKNEDTYTRDLGNWEYLCRRCHMLKDGRMKNLKRGRKPKEFAPCGRDIAARGICLKQYNYERRRTGTDWQNWTRRERAKPCESCAG